MKNLNVSQRACQHAQDTQICQVEEFSAEILQFLGHKKANPNYPATMKTKILENFKDFIQ